MADLKLCFSSYFEASTLWNIYASASPWSFSRNSVATSLDGKQSNSNMARIWELGDELTGLNLQTTIYDNLGDVIIVNYNRYGDGAVEYYGYYWPNIRRISKKTKRNVAIVPIYKGKAKPRWTGDGETVLEIEGFITKNDIINDDFLDFLMAKNSYFEDYWYYKTLALDNGISDTVYLHSSNKKYDGNYYISDYEMDLIAEEVAGGLVPFKLTLIAEV